MEVQVMFTSYVGSFPLEYSRGNLERILKDVLEIPIDYPCYPQLQDFIAQFLNPLVDSGILERRKRGYILLEEVSPRVNVFKAEEQALWTVEYIRRSPLRERISGLKACVTGPFTLSTKIYIDEPLTMSNLMINSMEHIENLLHYLRVIIRDLSNMGYEYINIDEPYLSVMVGKRMILHGYSTDDIIDILDRLARTIPKISGIHVCGRLSPELVEILSQTSFLLLDHEFADTPQNFQAFSREILEDYDKFIALGILSSKRPVLETPKEALKIIENAVKKYGVERIRIIKPDCGFRGLKGVVGTSESAYEIAIKKLKLLNKIKLLAINRYGIDIEELRLK